MSKEMKGVVGGPSRVESRRMMSSIGLMAMFLGMLKPIVDYECSIEVIFIVLHASYPPVPPRSA